jgi:hypothetical protein
MRWVDFITRKRIRKSLIRVQRVRQKQKTPQSVLTATNCDKNEAKA